MRAIFAIVIAFCLTGCAVNPVQTVTELKIADPKYSSDECKAIRQQALNYDDKLGERVAVGLASGLLLGPFGLPIAAAADAAQDKQRELFNKSLCATA